MKAIWVLKTQKKELTRYIIIKLSKINGIEMMLLWEMKYLYGQKPRRNVLVLLA